MFESTQDVRVVDSQGTEKTTTVHPSGVPAGTGFVGDTLIVCAAVENRGARAGADGRFENVVPWITSAVNSGDNTERFTFGLAYGHSEGEEGVTRHGQVDEDPPTGTG